MTVPPIVVDAAVRSSAVLGLTLVTAACLRRGSAALRHMVLAVGIACAAATPLLSHVVPTWGTARVVEPAAVLITLDDDAAPSPAAARVPSHTASEWMVSVWAAGACGLLLVLAAGLVHLRGIARRSRPASNLWIETAAEVSRAYGLERSVALLQTDVPALLVTWGAIRPAVFLPADVRGWTAERARVVLAHEFAHVRRRDWAVQVGASVVRALFWFNPLVWIACRRLSHESERAADDLVLALGIGGSEYAGHLVELARAFRSQRSEMFGAAPAIVEPSTLERRIRAMLQLGLDRTPFSRAALAATILALTAITVPLAGFGASQTGLATLSGTLVDTLGRILPDVPVTLTNTRTATTTDTRTGAAGTFSLANLEPGEYELSASLPGFGGKYRLVLGPGANVSREIPLQIGTVQETINVRRNVPFVAKPGRPAPDYHPESDPCRTSAIGGCIAPPLKLKDVKPEYPSTEAGATIRLRAVIGTDGFVHNVTGVDVAPADQAFARSAVAAVSGWQFTPTRLDGVAVETQMNVTVAFVPQ